MAATMDSAVPPTNEMSVANTMDGDVNGSPLEVTWTIDDIRKNSPNWTLAGDAGLLSYLQAFSQKLISETHDMEKELSKLIRETKSTNSVMHNAVNDFLSLSNTQFVENRVYDEEIEESPKEEKKPQTVEKSKKEKEAELIPKISSALSLGLDVIESAFFKLELDANDTDSEDEDSSITIDPVLEPKDPYINRYLPALIGSSSFLEDEYVGLRDEISEEGTADQDDDEESDKKTENSDFSESSYDVSGESDVEETKVKSSKSKQISEESWEETDGSSLFDGRNEERMSASSYESSDSDTQQETRIKKTELDSDVDEERSDDVDDKTDQDDVRVQQPKLDFTAELSSKLGLAVQKPRPEISENIDDIKEKSRSNTVQSGKKSKSRNKKRSSVSSKKSRSRTSTLQTAVDNVDRNNDMFAPNIEEEDDSPFGKTVGLFSGGGSLFDDDNEQGGLFDDVEKTAIGKEKKKPNAEQKPKDSGKVKTKEQKKRTSSKSSTKKTKQSTSLLFDDQNDDDLFSPKTHRSSMSNTESSVATKDTSALFNVEDSEDVTEQLQKESKPVGKQLPAGAVSMFGGGLGSSLKAALKSRRNEDSLSDQDDDDWNDQPTSEPVLANPTVKNLTSAAKTVSSEPSRSNSVSSNSLFVDDPDANDLFVNEASSKIKSKSSNLLFEDEDDLFSSSTKVNSSKIQSKKEPEKKSTESSTSKPASLFAEEDEDDLFYVAAKPKDSGKRRAPIGGVSLFGDDKANSVTAEIKQVPKQVVASNQVENNDTKTRTKTTLSLFDDEDEDTFDDGLFSTKTKKSTDDDKKMGKSKMLFEDEDILFGGPSEESPSVDLFSSNQNTKEEVERQSTRKLPTTKQTEVTSNMQVGSATNNLFEDNDDVLSSLENNLAEVMQESRRPSILNDFENSTEQNKVAMFESDIATSTDKSNESDVVSVSPKKKLPGAVSMFGGIDPFAGRKGLTSFSKEKTSSTIKDQPSEISAEQHIDDKSADKVDNTTSVKPKFGLNIDPTALLPGAKPRPKEFKEASISFEDPPDTNTLTSVVKDRVRAGIKRRPPTRKGRKEARASVVDKVSTPQPESVGSYAQSAPTSPSNIRNLNEEPPKTTFASKSNVADELFSPETEEEDIFSITVSEHNISERDNEFPDSSLFTKPEVATVADDVFSQKTQTKLLNSESADNNSVPSNITEETNQKTVLDDDIFNISSKKSSAINENIFDDDIFSVPSTKPKKNVIDDDDDIFKVPTTKPTKNVIDDIFEVQSTVSTQKSKSDNQHSNTGDVLASAKPSVNEPKSNLFGDKEDNDIFSSIHSSKSSKMTQNKSKITKDSIFGDDDSEDIFANIPSRPKSTSKTKINKKSAVSKSSKTNDDIFDDPLMANLK